MLGVFEEIRVPLEQQADKFRNLHLNTRSTVILTVQAYLPLLPFAVPLHNCTNLVTFSYQSPNYSSAGPNPILSYVCTFIFPRVLLYLEAVGNKFLCNITIYVSNYMESHAKRQ
jgi:hypothetical protein